MEVIGSPVDPDFGFVAEGHFDLNRKVEVLMWEEKIEYHTQRIGDYINQAAKVDYQAHWRDAESFVDSSSFLDKTKDLNIPTDLRTTNFAHEKIKLGPYDIESNLVNNVGSRV